MNGKTMMTSCVPLVVARGCVGLKPYKTSPFYDSTHTTYMRSKCSRSLKIYLVV